MGRMCKAGINAKEGFPRKMVFSAPELFNGSIAYFYNRMGDSVSEQQFNTQGIY